MARKTWVLAAGLLGISTAGLIGGCPVPSGTVPCERTVSTTPSTGFFEMTTTLDYGGSSTPSALAKVLNPGALCEDALDNTPPPFEDFRTLYEVGADGEVINQIMLGEVDGVKTFMSTPATLGLRFVAEDGCLTFDFETSENGEDPQDDPFDPDFEIDPGPCGEGQFALGRDGTIMDADTTEDFICLDFSRPESRNCITCSEQGGTWRMEAEVTVVMTARGTLDNVSVSTWAMLCGEEDVPVTINEGDKETLSLTSGMVVTSSLSPEELGYTDASPPGDGE